MQSNCSKALWADLAEKPGLDGDGHIVDHT